MIAAQEISNFGRYLYASKTKQTNKYFTNTCTENLVVREKINYSESF